MSEPGYDVDIGNSVSGDAGDDYNYQYDRPQDSGPHGRNSADINKTMTKKKKKKKKKRMIQFRGRGNGGAGDLLEAKRVALSPFAKAKKHLPPSNNTNSRKRSPSSAAAAAVPKATISCFPRAGNYKAGLIGSCLCLKQPCISESPVGSHSSDPNDPSFSLDKLKSLIEKNNFYSEDYNPHFDSNQ